MTPIEVPRAIRDGVVIGATQAIVFLALLFALVTLLGNQQQETLVQIRVASENQQRANACVLALPVNPEPAGATRDEGMVNAFCLVPLGFAPVDVNGDGATDVNPGRPFGR